MSDYSTTEPNDHSSLAIEDLWTEYRNWLSPRLPIYANLLYPPASAEQIQTLWAALPVEPSDELTALYTMNNGESSEDPDLLNGSFMGFEFLPIEKVLTEYTSWMKIHNELDWSQGYYGSSFPEGHIKIQYTNPHWIPVFADAAGNYIGIDNDPDALGHKGQIINFGRDEDDKIVIAPSLTAFLQLILEEIRSGACDQAIVREDDNEWSYGLRPQSHLIDDLKKIILKK